ncbi:MAG: DUF4382 domain-containing protein [Gammaproteobacteria bacterium]|nr:MAG: DUF4382 domain-containing protein [Gammaproteobacteria bacterium]
MRRDGVARIRDFASWRGLCFGALLALLAACGGSSGGLDLGAGDGEPVGSAPGDSDGSGTGSLGITVGDDPTRDFDEILITVNSVSLLGEGQDDPLLLSDQPFTFDLLALDAATELLVAVDNVPVGSYSKIRLQLDSIELRKVDEDGELTEDPVDVRLVANGKLDLNPRGVFEIAEGRVVIVQLDIQAGRSFLVIQTGAGRTLFRPVVFVDILGDGDLRRITFLTGTIRLLAPPDGDEAFELCDARPLTGRGLGDRRLDECRRIDFAPDIALFDADANPIELAAIDDQSPAIVAGRVIPVDGRVGFEALMVQLGERSDFKRVRGFVAEDVDDGAFRLISAPDADETGIAVSVQPGALLFDQDGEILEVSALTAGTPVRAMGLLLPASDPDPAQLLATAISIDTGPSDDEGTEVLRGEITALTVGDSRIDLALEAGEGCAVFSEDTVFSIVTTDEGDGVTAEPGSAPDLEVGQQIEAVGLPGEDGCILANEIIIEIEATEEV